MTRALWVTALAALFLALHTAGLAAWERLEAPCACGPTPGTPYVYPAGLPGTSTASIHSPRP